MSPEDAEIIRDIFDKIGAMGSTVDDVEAARLVASELAANPAAALNLVKVVVGLERERDDYAAHVDELNGYIDQLEAQLQPQAAPPSSGGSLFGSPQASPWSRSAPAAHDPRYVEPQPQAGPWGAPQPQGSSFWGSALRTGAGVAGGLLAVEAVKGLFGGGHAAQAHESEHRGLFEAEPRGGREERSGGFGGDEPQREPFVADNIDFFGGSDET